MLISVALLAACGNDAQANGAASVTSMSPVAACTNYVLNKVETTVQAENTNADINRVFSQVTNDYGESSPEFIAFSAALKDPGFLNVRLAHGVQAGLTYLRPTVASTCGDAAAGASASPSVDPN